MCNTFNLKKACKDCPFKKGNTYLHPEGLKERFNHVTKQDRSFSCHKTVDYDAYNEYREAQSEIEEILQCMAEDGHSFKEISTERQKLESDPHFIDVRDKYQTTLKNEMYCAGMLILVKKENMIFNNFPLRYAVSKGLLDLNQFKDEHEVYDSIHEAINAHANGI
ncbi:hypothetical protein DJ533_00410 (plasmid) [Acinetobacter defluvii]|uniref:Uncharacterized protein n=1 Tax=Acinetobacter defluvii TaxID=1871111 RepID=A0A2S2F8D8_9GAMM|nr:hypothetical protein [Acinetobacter defluvii]AWL27180.1 hypothetical protein DJ533_00410 [Acinetobacter defluvii]